MDLETEHARIENWLEGHVWRVNDDRRTATFRVMDDLPVRGNRMRVDTAQMDTSNFMRNPVFVWGHDAYGGFNPPQIENVIGRGTNVRRVPMTMGEGNDELTAGQAIDIDFEFATKAQNPKAEIAFQLVRGGFLNAVSGGFAVGGSRTEKRAKGQPNVEVLAPTELLEVSLVPIPKNPRALQRIRQEVDSFDEGIETHTFDEGLLTWALEKCSPPVETPPADSGVSLMDAITNRWAANQDRKQRVHSLADRIERHGGE